LWLLSSYIHASSYQMIRRVVQAEVALGLMG
jgi:hypothetical protein